MSQIPGSSEMHASEAFGTFEEELVTNAELITMLKWGIETNEAQLESGELDAQDADTLKGRVRRMRSMLAAQEEKSAVPDEDKGESSDGTEVLEQLASYHREQADVLEGQRKAFLGGEVPSPSGSGFFDPHDVWVNDTAESLSRLRQDHLSMRDALLARLPKLHSPLDTLSSEPKQR